MDLRDYLHKYRIQKQEFAQKIRYSIGYVGKVAEFKKRPSRRFAEDLERVTGGMVTADEVEKASYESDKGVK